MTKSWRFLFVTINLILLFDYIIAGTFNRGQFNSNENNAEVLTVQRTIRQHDNRHNTTYACEGETLNLTCPKGYWIKIIRANYGRFSLNICNDKEMQWADTQCKNPKTSRIMEERCSNRSSCIVQAVVDVFGDVCPDMDKYLEVQHKCLSKDEVSTTSSTSMTTTTTTSTTTTTVPFVVKSEPIPTESNNVGREKPGEILYPKDLTTSTVFEIVKPQFCPAMRFRGIEWPSTPLMKPVFMPCPNNNRKQAFWHCGSDGIWKDHPEMTLCTSDWIEEVQKNSFTVSNVDDTIQLAENVQEHTKVNEDLYGGDTVALTSVLRELVTKVDEQILLHPVESRFAVVKRLSKAIVETASNLLQERRKESWEDLHPDTQIKSADQLINSIEENGLLLAKVSTNTETIPSPNVVIEVGFVQIQDYVKFPARSLYDPKLDSIQIPKGALEEGETTRPGWSKVVFASFENLGQFMKPYSLDGEIERKVVSNILSASMVDSRSVVRLKDPVLITFSTKKNENLSNPTCVFWHVDPSDRTRYGGWSPEGCQLRMHNDSHTVCACNHLTSFAVLMDVQGVYISSGHYLALSLITYVGCIISIVALTLCLAAFCLFRGVQGDRATIHKNLCFCLLIAETVFLFGIAQVQQKIACTVIAAVLHYFFLAAFGWMLMEGFQLYALLVEVFESEQSRKKYFYLFAYGMPLIIVGISLGVDHTSYGTRRHCWLNTDNYFVFSFVGPVIVVLFTNLVFLTMALVVMCRHRGSWNASYKHSPTKTSVENFAAWLKAAIVLVFLLGLTWTFGLFYISQETQIVAYIFTVLNSLQGVFIFLFHVVLNEKMRKEYRKWLRRNDWLPNWVRDSAMVYDPNVCGVGPCGGPVNSNSSSNGIRSGATSPVNTVSTNSGNTSYLQRLFRPLTSKRDSNRPLLGRSSSSNSGSSGKHIYEYGYGRQRNSDFSVINSPRYIGGLRPVPKFPPPLPPYSFDDPDLSTFDCSVVDSQYVNDFGQALDYCTSSSSSHDVAFTQMSPLRSDPDSGYNGGDSESFRQGVATTIKNFSKQTSDQNNYCCTATCDAGGERRRSSFDSNHITAPIQYAPDTICCKSAPSLRKPDGCSHLMSDCEKQTQTDEDLVLSSTTPSPLMSLPDLNYEIPVSSLRNVGRHLRTNAPISSNDSKLPLRVRSCNK